ncbi:MAG TPA: carboxypeptidase regulatory-like domain-containing protein, partial [Candidatus Polarisedimenticolia bacterium]|nr:carboxypeptidase regulatory-like domain-containing protein [Candidatus Polarisedimenticolia bacterium]
MVNARSVRLTALLTSLLLVFSAFTYAQNSPGTVKGVVVDKDGGPLPGATVTLENRAIGVVGLGGVTNAQGEFRVSPVPAGKAYALRVSLPGYQKIEFTIEVYAGKTVVQNVTLREEFKERIKVIGKEEIVNTESAQGSTTISSEFISGLPILGTDYQDVLTLAPGVTDVNGTGNPNIHGARDTDVVTLVDGVSTTDPFDGHFGQNLNTESIEEIEVITSGAGAQYGRAQGGFVNILTKSGGNEFKGTFSFKMRSNKLDGDGAGIDKADVRGGLGETDSFRNLAFTDLYPYLSVSGAFIRDHLWYVLAPEYVQVETPINA